MWIFTNNSFLSVVQDANDPNYLIVRSRDREHLYKFGAPESEIIIIPGSDYQYRIKMHKTTFGVMMAQLINKINYTNFKGNIADTKYKQALFEIWHVMYEKYYDEYQKVEDDGKSA